jgi:major capsid protein E
MAFDILGRVIALSPASLTVREQARLAQNPNELRWRDIFPVQDADTSVLKQIETVDFRPVADFREWNADGRTIPEVLGPQVELEMVPISANHPIDEKRLQKLSERAPDLAELVNRGVIADVDAWAGRLADAVDRHIERAAFECWALNQITAMDPKTGSTVTVSRGVAGARYVTEGTAWATVANAYDRLLFHLGEAQRLMGSVGPVRMRRATYATVVADAPTGPGAVRPTVANVADRLSEEGFGEITIIIDERTIDVWTDGGSAYTSTALIPTGRVLFSPASGVVGRTYNVPLVRAASQVGNDKRVNLRDVVIWYTTQNEGKTLKIIGERLALPVTTEQSTYVVNAIT